MAFNPLALMQQEQRRREALRQLLQPRQQRRQPGGFSGGPALQQLQILEFLQKLQAASLSQFLPEFVPDPPPRPTPKGRTGAHRMTGTGPLKGRSKKKRRR